MKPLIYSILLVFSILILFPNSINPDSITLLNDNKINGNIFEIKVGEYVKIQLENQSEITVHWDEIKEYTDEVYSKESAKESVKISDIVGKYEWKFKSWKSPVTIEIKLEGGKITFSGENPQGKVMSGSGFLNENQVIMRDWVLGSGEEALKGTHKIVFSKDGKTFFSFIKYENEQDQEYVYQGIRIENQPTKEK